MHGSSKTVVADTIINDVTVNEFDQTVCFQNGDPFWRPSNGMTNRLLDLPA
jgi:hypothetical protein